MQSARLLANQARPELRAAGLSDLRSDELASAFIAKDLGEDLGGLVRWARAQGATASAPDEVL